MEEQKEGGMNGGTEWNTGTFHWEMSNDDASLMNELKLAYSLNTG